ncbi:MAG: selenocysteine-specific translation elongation factor [Fidelibacterota bacterium]|nr:MAG: selenocysteine-specific translation elongation factor [Candidatus Neomarinimicrobiota bacterium]
MSHPRQVVIGLAGHIDHGKTALVQALTGVDTDTQEEEKRRGMTIDIGFAFLTDSITFVDVPGHDRFVKNMVRGVAGIHMGLLVVAADDGVMTQTREHFHILRFLGVQRICVAVNKVDLVENDWLELVEEDIRQLLAGTPYQESPVVRVSAIERTGLEALRVVLIEEAGRIRSWEDRGFFRLPIDRVFSLKGFGTVVTGTVISGSLKLGDSVELVPGTREVKLRGIQSHGANVDQVVMGDRAALNIANLSADRIEHGEQLATPEYVAPTKTLAIEISLLDEAPTLPHNHPVRVNIGTAEVIARLKLPDTSRLKPSRTAGAILELQEPTPIVAGDRLILRSFSPITTIGGGIVLDTEMPRWWRDRKRWVTRLVSTSPADRLMLMIGSRNSRPFSLAALSRRWGWAEQKLRTALPEEILQVGRTENPWLVTGSQSVTLNEQIVSVVTEYHRTYPYNRGANREFIRQQVNGDERFLEEWLKGMVDQGLLKVSGETWSLHSFSVQLSDEDETLLSKIVDTLEQQGFQVEYVEALAVSLDIPLERLLTLCVFAEGQGRLVRINQRIFMHRDTVDRLIGAVGQHFREHRELTVADAKEITGTTRKHTVPLLEYLDRNSHTIRVGDKRQRPGE